MLVIVLVVLAVIAAFVSGALVGAANDGAVRRQYRRLHPRRVRWAVRDLLRARPGACDVCLGYGLIVDHTTPEGHGVWACWSYSRCRARARYYDARRQARIDAAAEFRGEKLMAEADVADIPF